MANEIAPPRAFLARADVNLVVVIGLWLALSLSYASVQELWVDETTQLSGLTLSPMELVPWLLGEDIDRFGVPGDRMPPVSYWVGQGWSSLFGLDESSMRAFGAVASALGIACACLAARRAFGSVAGWVCGLILTLSPASVNLGVEIRAYPLFFFFSCLAVLQVVRLLLPREGEGGKGAFCLLGMTCVLACYTHYFGLLLTGAALVAVLSGVHASPRQRVRWLLCCLVTLGCAAGLYPFVKASMGISSMAEETESIARGVVRLGYRLLGGSPMTAASTPLLALSLLGSAALLVVALLSPLRPALSPQRRLAVGLVAGAAVATLAARITAGFDALATHYNVWMVPFVAVIASSAVATPQSRLRQLAWTGFAALALGGGGGTLLLLTRPEPFAHTAANRVAAKIRAAGGPANVSVVHDGSTAWASLYFPLRYLFGTSLAQSLAVVDAAGGLEIKLLAGPPGRNDPLATRLLLVHAGAPQDSADIRTFLASGQPPDVADLGIAASLQTSRGLTTVATETLMSLTASEIVWLERK